MATVSGNETRVFDIQVTADAAIAQLARYNEQIDELKTKMKQLDKSSADYRGEQARLQEQIKGVQAAKRELSGEVQKAIVMQTREKNSLREMEARLSSMKTQWKNMSDVERQSNQALLQSIQALDKEIKDLSHNIGENYKEVGNYEEAIKRALFGNTAFGNSLQGLSANAATAGGMFVALGTTMKAFGRTLMTLMKNPVFLILAGIAGAVSAFKGLLDYNKNIAEATRLTEQFLGVEGQALSHVRGEIQAIADVYGKEYTEVLSTVDALVAEFGISIDEAMRIIREGFQAGSDFNGDFLAQVNQYKGSFHDAGIEADKMVAIIAQSRSGIFSKDGMAAIEKANQRIRLMSTQTRQALQGIGVDANKVVADLSSGSRDTFDVIQEVSNKLRELPAQSQAVGEVLQYVFGKQAAAGGTELIKSLGDIETSLEVVKGQTGAIGEATDELTRKEAELNEKMDGLFNLTEEGWDVMWKQVKVFVDDAIISLIEKMQETYNEFVDLYNESSLLRAALAGIGLVVKTIGSVFGLVFKEIGNVISSAYHGVMGFTKVLGGMWEAVRGNFDKGWQMIKDGGAQVINSFKTMATTTLDNITDLFKSFASNVRGAQDTMINGRLEKVDIGQAAANAAKKNSGGGGGTTTAKEPKGSSGSRGGKTSSRASTGKSEAEKQAEDEAKRRTQIAEWAEKEITRRTEAEWQERIKISRDALVQYQQMQLTQLVERMNQFEGVQTDEARRAYDNLSLLYNKMIADNARALEAFDAAVATASAETAKTMADANLKAAQLEEQLLEKRLARVEQGSEKEAELQQLLAEARARTLGAELSQMDAAHAAEQQKMAEDYAAKLQLYKDDEAMKAQLETEYNQMRLQREREYRASRDMILEEYAQNEQNRASETAAKEVEIERAKQSAISGLMNSASQVMDELGESSKAFAVLGKTLALGEIIMNQGVAQAYAIREAMKKPAPMRYIELATAITTIMSGIASALKTVKSVKFATGGDVVGAGTGTSDSITAQLSNGESVITAKATAAYAPYLSAINQAGGGVPIYGQNAGVAAMQNDVIMGRMAQVMANVRPVVSVVDINEGQNRVEVIQNRARL